MAVTFTWWGTELELFDAEYNTTLLNERAVEIPIATRWLDGRVMADGVEVGAVLPHYSFPAHPVCDLYEVGAGIDNVDLFELVGSFDWILSISTLEHVADAAGALDHLRRLLAPGGSMLVTVGAGQHADLDRYLATGADAARCTTLVRSGDTWCQTMELQFLRYASSTRWAESVFIGEWEG